MECLRCRRKSTAGKEKRWNGLVNSGTTVQSNLRPRPQQKTAERVQGKSVSAAPLTASPTSTLWLSADLYTHRAHSLTESRPCPPSSDRAPLIQSGVCFPFTQKDSLGQIGAQQSSFGADQHSSEAIPWNRSSSVPGIIFRLDLELRVCGGGLNWTEQF